MSFRPHLRRAGWRHMWALTAVFLLIAGAFSANLLGAPAAHADPTVRVLANGTPEAWAPYLSATSDHLGLNQSVSISCYLTGDSVSGAYGTENVWDLISGGGPTRAQGGDVDTGTFVPDADVYTGSNSPVVPACSTHLGQTIGGNLVPLYSGPGTNYSYVGPVNSGQLLEISCYRTGTSVNGPYGAEKIWDLITVNWMAPAVYIPDALVYTGSNSAVVPPCS